MGWFVFVRHPERARAAARAARRGPATCAPGPTRAVTNPPPAPPPPRPQPDAALKNRNDQAALSKVLRGVLDNLRHVHPVSVGAEALPAGVAGGLRAAAEAAAAAKERAGDRAGNGGGAGDQSGGGGGDANGMDVDR